MARQRVRRFERPGVDEHREDDQVTVVLLGHERQRRRGHHIGDRRQLFRRCFRLGDERADQLRRRRQHEHAAGDPVDLVQSELEPRGNAEVAAAAADRPEQIWMGLGVGAKQTAVGGHDIGGEQVVDREAVLADEVPDATSQRDPTDPDRAGVPEPRGEAVCGCLDGVLARRQARLGPGGAPFDVDLEFPEVREVEHDPAFRHAVPGSAVAAAADRELEAGLACKRDHTRDIGGIRGPHDHRRPAIDVADEHGPRGVVPVVLRRDHLTRDEVADPRDRDR